MQLCATCNNGLTVTDVAFVSHLTGNAMLIYRYYARRGTASEASEHPVRRIPVNMHADAVNRLPCPRILEGAEHFDLEISASESSVRSISFSRSGATNHPASTCTMGPSERRQPLYVYGLNFVRQFIVYDNNIVMGVILALESLSLGCHIS